MKLRTVLSQLKATAHVEGPLVSMDDEVIVFPGDEAIDPIPELLTLSLDPKGASVSSDYGMKLVYMGTSLPEGQLRPAERVVCFASPLSKEEVEQGFVLLPKVHVYLELQQKRIFRAFQVSYDVQRFADELYAILGNPLMIVNSDRRLLASAGDFPDERADVIEEIEQGYISEEVDAEMEAAGILDDVRHAGHSIISENARFGQRWVTSVISYHHMEMGRLDLLEQDHVINDADLELVDFATLLAGILIDRLGLAGKRAGSGSSVLDDILGSELANEKTMRAQLALSSMPLDDTYAVIVLSGERELPRAHLQRIALRVTRAFRNSLWTILDGRLVVMVALGARTCSGWDAYQRAERVFGQRKRFVGALEQNGLTAYVCEPFEQLSLAHIRYEQALDLMRADVEREGSIVYLWHHRYEVIASLAQSFGQVDLSLDKRVVAMSLYDHDHGTSYLDTACRTVEFPGSPSEAAKALNVHRNTYFYRVNKIAELFFLDLRTGEDRLAVAYSTRMLSGMGGKLLFDIDQMPQSWRSSVGNNRARS